MEAIKVLKGEERDNNLTKLCLELASEMLCMSKGVPKEDAMDMVRQSIQSGDAYQKFLELVNAQHGNLKNLSVSKKIKVLKASKGGKITGISAIELGKLSVSLGAGRMSKEDNIDYGVGIELLVQVGDTVKKGDSLAKIYYTKAPHLQRLEDIFLIK